MTVPFLKLQLAGNGFILVDLGQLDKAGTPLAIERFGLAARTLCDRRYGVGATACVFLGKDNSARIFGAQGQETREADDAYLCAARYAFDSGRLSGKSIVFATPFGEKRLDVLGAHEFRLALGSPFSLLTGKVIADGGQTIAETIEREGVRASYSAIHVHDDAVVAFPGPEGVLSYGPFSALVQKAFPGKQVLPAIARAITRETILVRTLPKRESGACTAAVAALVAGKLEGMVDAEAMVVFEQTGSDGQPDQAIARDRDNSRRLAAFWESNELSVIGSGGYLFEGKFDLSDE